MRKINYKYWYKGRPVAQILPGSDYTLFQAKVAYQGMTVKAAIEYVLNSREARRLKQAALASKTIRDRFTEPAAMRKAEKKFYRDGIARLEKAFRERTGRDYPPPCPRPATSPKSLDMIYLTTRYGAIKLALLELDAQIEERQQRRAKREAAKERKARLERFSRCRRWNKKRG